MPADTTGIPVLPRNQVRKLTRLLKYTENFIPADITVPRQLRLCFYTLPPSSSSPNPSSLPSLPPHPTFPSRCLPPHPLSLSYTSPYPLYSLQTLLSFLPHRPLCHFILLYFYFRTSFILYLLFISSFFFFFLGSCRPGVAQKGWSVLKWAV